MICLDLFCGTKSFTKVAEKKGYKVISLDIEEKFKPTLLMDIKDLKREYLPKKINIVWASPPCTVFSVASIHHYWKNGKPKNNKTLEGINIVKKTLQLIEEIKKDNPNLIYFIENPRGMLRKQDFIKKYPRRTVTYCQYGDTRQKPTDIWSNAFNWKSRPACSKNSACHESSRRGSKTGGTQNLANAEARAVIPENLFYEIFKHLKNNKLEKQLLLK